LENDMRIYAFHPAQLPTQKLAAGTATGAVSVPLDANSNAVRVYNAGPNAARIHFSGSSGAAVAATASDMPIPANTVEIFAKGRATFVTSITDTGTAALEFTDGEGV
jgi:hypothetical protein